MAAASRLIALNPHTFPLPSTVASELRTLAARATADGAHRRRVVREDVAAADVEEGVLRVMSAGPKDSANDGQCERWAVRTRDSANEGEAEMKGEAETKGEVETKGEEGQGKVGARTSARSEFPCLL